MLAATIVSALAALYFGIRGLSSDGTDFDRLVALSALFMAAAAAIARSSDERPALQRRQETRHWMFVTVGAAVVVTALPVVSIVAGVILLTFAALVYLLLPLFLAWSLDEDEHERSRGMAGHGARKLDEPLGGVR